MCELLVVEPRQSYGQENGREHVMILPT